MTLLRSKIIEELVSGAIYCSGMPDPKKKGKFDEWCEKYVQPASLDLPMGKDFYLEIPNSGQRHPNINWHMVDTNAPAETQFKYWSSDIDGELLLGPNKYALGRTADVIGLSPHIIATVSTRSTAGRWGIDTRRSAGFIDPGYRGPITLEIHNDSSRLVPITPGLSYCQLVFSYGEGEPAAYDGHYRIDVDEKWNPSRMLPKTLIK